MFDPSGTLVAEFRKGKRIARGVCDRREKMPHPDDAAGAARADARGRRGAEETG